MSLFDSVTKQDRNFNFVRPIEQIPLEQLTADALLKRVQQPSIHKELQRVAKAEITKAAAQANTTHSAEDTARQLAYDTLNRHLNRHDFKKVSEKLMDMLRDGTATPAMYGIVGVQKTQQ